MMKLIVILFIAICLNATTKVYAQTISLSETNTALDAVFKKIRKQTDYNFAGTKELLKKASPVNIHLENIPLGDALEQIFAGQPLDYTIYNKVIIIKDKDTTHINEVSLNLQDHQTYTITGIVSDAKGIVIPGATVFLSNTKSSTATDDAGKFTLGDLQPGTYELVIKMLGFNIYSQPIIIQKRSPDLRIELTENVITLNTVNVVAISGYERKKYLQLFTQFFIGESDNAAKCRLLNPEVVNFSFDKQDNVLDATSDQFIIIENKSLGYKVHCLLKEFKLDMHNFLLTYSVSLYFEELEGTNSQQKKWAKNRQSTYEGSIGHFFKAAFANKLKEEGFLVFKFPDKEALNKAGDKIDPKYLLPLSSLDLLFINIDKNIKLFNLQELKKDSTDLYVVYTRKNEPDAYKAVSFQTPFLSKLLPYRIGINPPFTMPNGLRQISAIHPLMDSTLVDRNGNITHAKNLLRSGFWSWQRTADLLPPDYNDTDKPPPTVSVVEARAVVKAIDTTRKQLPTERLYLQLDKPYFTLGDTLRFKSYLLSGDFLLPSIRSGMLYVELDDEVGRTIKRIMIPLVSGISWGQIALDAITFTEGSYTLRAYTNWMRNFGEEQLFKKNIYISSLGGATLVNANFKLQNGADKDKVQANLRFTDMDNEALRLKDLRLQVMNGKRALFKDKVTTAVDGSLDINFDLADKTAVNNLSIKVKQAGKGADTTMLTIPVSVNRIENTDLQFMPEGGNMLANIDTKIALKAIGEDGKGVEVTGSVYNSKQQEVATFASTHAGMGSFELLPQAGETYSAKINLPAGIIKTYALPVVSPTGTALRVSPKGADSLEITISSTPDLLTTSGNYYLIGQSRGVVCYAGLVNFKEKQLTVIRRVAKDVFPTGVARFTLLSADKLPMNERILYIDHDDNLQINIAANQPKYTTRDSVALAILVKNKEGKPIQGTFSLAVTDDSQVKTDNLGSNIINNLLLAADLKGNIEEPAWYFEISEAQRVAALDNLLLTQGWIGYDWKQVFAPTLQQPQYPAEREFTVQGKVSNTFNKPLKNTNIILFSQKPELIRDTVTDNEGKFLFRGIFPVDTAAFKLQARNRNGASLNGDIEMLNEFKSPEFHTAKIAPPWYVNSDTTLLNNTKTKQAQLKAEAAYRGEGNRLSEVIIKEKKVVEGSVNLNGPGEADQVLNRQNILKAGKITLGELLEKNIKGFALKTSPKENLKYYAIYDKKVRIIFDGMDPLLPKNTVAVYKEILDYYTAEEIKGIEVMYNTQYNQTYGAKYDGMALGWQTSAFIEITTRSKKGPWMNISSGTYLYKPLPFTLPKQFYRPRYTVQNSSIGIGTDLRSTVHWEPNVVTDAEGKATVSFFTADKPGAYTVVIEGADLDGDIGYRREQIKVVTSPIVK